jgi:hypothetical protein
MSEQGIYHRGRRCIEPEAVFAQIKHNSAWNRFRLRGLEKVKIESALQNTPIRIILKNVLFSQQHFADKTLF